MRVMKQIESNQSYCSDDGWSLNREQGETPNGEPIDGRWVLRNPLGEFLDVDQYRHDMAARHKLKLGHIE